MLTRRIGTGLMALCAMATAGAQAATFTLQNSATGNWSAPATWTANSGFPNAVGDIAEGTFSNSTSGGNITVRDTTLDVSAVVAQVRMTSTGTWNVLASGSNTLTMDATSTGTTVIGRTSNNSGAGLLSVAPNLVLNDTLSIRNVGGSAVNTAVSVQVDGTITGNAAVNVRQGDSGSNNGQNGGRAIDINGLVNNTGAVTVTSGSIGGSSRLAETGNVRFDGGFGQNVTGITIDAENRNAVIMTNSLVFDLGATPDAGIDFNSSTTSGIGGSISIAGLTVDFAGVAILPVYTLLDYAGSELPRLTLATNAATANTFGSVVDVPVNYQFVHDTVNKQVRLELIPEPASLALASAGLALLATRRRRV